MFKSNPFIICVVLAIKISVLAYEKNRIVGGHKTSIKSHPHMVAIVVELPQSFMFRCGGGIIADKWTLTAAHCYESLFSPVSYRVFGGGTSWINGHKHKVSTIIVHGSYDPLDKACDIALVKTIEPFTFAFEKPIPFARRSHHFSQNVPVTATGWGKDSEGGKVQETLVEVSLSFYDHSKCKTIYESYVKVTDKHFCLYTKYKDTCQGDSGGPTVQNGVLIGIVSFGIGCAKDNTPGVYTKVSEFEDWILAKSNNLNDGVENRLVNIYLLILGVVAVYVLENF